MSALLWTYGSDVSIAADRVLRIAGRCWFVAAVTFQLMLAGYVIAFYGGSAVHGDFQAWNQVVPHAYTPGRTMSNLSVALHLAMAVIVIVCGSLQFIPQVRIRTPRFHRWNGRLYAVAILLISVTGLQMIWSRAYVSIVQYLGTGLHAILVMGCAVLAVRYAVAGEISSHRRWALRLFVVVNAGLFFRIGLLQWILLDRPLTTVVRPFLSFWSLADYLLPLIILEIYLHTRDHGNMSGRFAMAAVLIVMTFAMSLGISEATAAMWLPRIRAVYERHSTESVVPADRSTVITQGASQ